MKSTSATTLPDVLSQLKAHVREDMTPGDDTAEELIELLDLAWISAERWRIEQYHRSKRRRPAALQAGESQAPIG